MPAKSTQQANGKNAHDNSASNAEAVLAPRPSDADIEQILADAAREVVDTRKTKPMKSSSAVEGFRHVFAKQWQCIAANEAGARSGADAEAVHDMRVATRRLRTALRAARGVIQAEVSERVRSDLKRLQDLLGDVRDRDIALQRLDRNAMRLPPAYAEALHPYREKIERQRTVARSALTAYLDSGDYAALDREVARFFNDDVWLEEVHGAYKKIVRRHAKKLAKRVQDNAAQLNQDSPDGTLHALRKDAKKARYALELLKPVNGKAVRKGIKQLKNIQDKLGAHRDAVVAHALAADAAGEFLSNGETPPATFVGFGHLMQLESTDAQSRREKFFSAWECGLRKVVKKRLKKAVKA